MNSFWTSGPGRIWWRIIFLSSFSSSFIFSKSSLEIWYTNLRFYIFLCFLLMLVIFDLWFICDIQLSTSFHVYDFWNKIHAKILLVLAFPKCGLPLLCSQYYTDTKNLKLLRVEILRISFRFQLYICILYLI